MVTRSLLAGSSSPAQTVPAAQTSMRSTSRPARSCGVMRRVEGLVDRSPARSVAWSPGRLKANS